MEVREKLMKSLVSFDDESIVLKGVIRESSQAEGQFDQKEELGYENCLSFFSTCLILSASLKT